MKCQVATILLGVFLAGTAQALPLSQAKRVFTLSKSAKLTHIKTVSKNMMEGLGTLEFTIKAKVPDEVVAAAAPVDKISDLHKKHSVERKWERAAEARELGLKGDDYLDHVHNYWLPMATRGTDGKTSLMRIENAFEYKDFLKTIPAPAKDGYMLKSNGQVYFNNNMPFEHLPEVARADSIEGDSFVWAAIHEWAKSGKAFTPEWVHEVSREVNRLWALRNQHKVELARLDLYEANKALSRHSYELGRAGKPHKGAKLEELKTAVTKAELEVERRERQVSGFDGLTSKDVFYDVRRVTELLKEYERLAGLMELDKVTDLRFLGQAEAKVAEVLRKARGSTSKASKAPKRGQGR